MEKAYDHNATEDGIYKSWEDSGNMRADQTSAKKSFTIPLPPPNVTGQLHLGHAAMLAIEDIMIRYQKMTGKEVLWLPGTDHAAIATENVVLKHLGLKNREEMSREDFLKECRKFAQEKHDRIVHQIKKMGAWLDWSREAYTFDDARNHAVNTIFKQLYDDGLIVRGHRMINWSVGAQSVLSDDEVEWEEGNSIFYEFWCGPFVIGTVRAETKCADSPVVVHPTAKYVRAKNAEGQECIVTEGYFKGHTRLKKDFEIEKIVKGKDLVGMKFEAETYAGKRKFWVLADEMIDPEFGTGAMTISTAHDPHDFELAQKYDLPLPQKIDFNGKMTEIAGPCSGLPVAEARKKAGEILEEKHLLLEKRPYVNRIPLCYRSGTVVEPMLSPQWFVSVEKEFTDKFTGKKTTLKKLTQEAVRDGHVKIIPKQFEKVYFQWIDNLRDWCISRQIWWGHQIPVWYDEKGEISTVGSRKTIDFMRHGESEWNAQGIIQGQYIEGNHLTEKGRDQAREKAKTLKKGKFKKIISSDLPRARETAEILRAELGIETEVEVWSELREWNTGTATKKTIKEIFGTDTFPYDQMVEKFETGAFGPEADTPERLLNRVKIVLKKLENEKDVLVVSHGGFLGTMKKFLQDGHLDKLSDFFKQQWDPQNSAVIALPNSYLRQDPDTLDTWFSSALWPFSTLGWPGSVHKPNSPLVKGELEGVSADFSKFYPADVLETGHDILFFWVARMIMFGRYATGKCPFHTVYLHGLVTDEHGKKMSKSAGNGIDPLEMIDEVGADAVRLSLVIGTSPGNPIPIGKAKISGYRNFVNKLWNAGRFVQMTCEQNPPQSPFNKGEDGLASSPVKGRLGGVSPKSLADKWILSRFSQVSKEVATHLQKHEISSAGDKVYHFVWDEFCDWYIEASKVEKNPAFLKHIFLEILKLTHPLCPFITETLWNELVNDGFLVDQEFPQSNFQDKESLTMFSSTQKMVTEIRRVRADNQLNPKEKLSISTSGEVHAELLTTLAGVKFESVDKKSSTKIVVGKCEIFVQIPIDEKRIAREKEALKSQIKSLESRLSNKGYTDKAPAHLIEQTQKELKEAQEKLKKLS